MRVTIHELISGAKRARGLTVIIDVFRAFSLECYMFRQGAGAVHPVGSLEEAFRLKELHPDWILFGERGGARVEGGEYGNSPSSIENADLSGRRIGPVDLRNGRDVRRVFLFFHNQAMPRAI